MEEVMATMNVLVVGGAGYVGGAVTDALLAKGVSFTVYDSLVYEPHYLKPVNFIRGDVRDITLLQSILPQFTHVIWLAAIVGDGACEVNPETTVAVNQTAVKWLSENYDGRILFTSTCSVYGASDDPVDENGVTNPLSLYAKTKLAAENFLWGNKATIFRLGTAFGLSDTYSRPRMDLVANQMPVSAVTAGKLTLYGGDQWRPMIHVRDIAAAITRWLDGPAGIFNLATVNLQMKELANICVEITGCDIDVKPMNEDKRNYRADTSKADAEGILCSYHSLRYGVRELASLIESGRVNDPASSVYFNVKHLRGAH